MSTLRRRDFLHIGMSTVVLAFATGCGGLPLIARLRVAHVGYISTDPQVVAGALDALREVSRDAGWVEVRTSSSSTAGTRTTPSASGNWRLSWWRRSRMSSLARSPRMFWL